MTWLIRGGKMTHGGYIWAFKLRREPLYIFQPLVLIQLKDKKRLCGDFINIREILNIMEGSDVIF